MANYKVTDTDLTAVANAIRTKGGTSAALAFPAGFVSAVQAIPTGGGGGATVVASGTAQGSGTYNMEIPIGTKMPIRNFIIALWANDNTEFTYDSAKRQYYGAEVALDGNVGYMGFLNREAGYARDVYSAKSSKAYTVNNGGTISTVDYNPLDAVFFGVFGTNTVYETVYQFQMYVYGDRVSFVLNRSNPYFLFPSTVTYNFKVFYYGSDPTNDFLEVS